MSSRFVILLLAGLLPSMGQTGRARIHVIDSAGAGIQGAQVSLLGSDNKPVRSEKTDLNGEAVFADLPLAECHFQVLKPDFIRRLVTATLQDVTEVNLDVELQVGEVLAIINESAPLLQTAPSKPPAPAKHRRWWIFR